MAEPVTRPVFFISDGTGITAETLGNSLLTQFAGRYSKHRYPFVSDVTEAHKVIERVSRDATEIDPIVFLTVMDDSVRQSLDALPGIVIDLVQGGLGTLETALGQKATRRHGQAHGISDAETYRDRMAAVEFALEHDDGQSLRVLGLSDVILVGPSRCGKTPTSMYLAIHHGIRAANYPLLDEEFEAQQLPESLVAHTDKLFCLVSSPMHLHQVREERRPGSPYASLDQCRFEISATKRLCVAHSIPTLDTSTRSIEEIATVILGFLHRLNSQGNHVPKQ